MTIRKALLAGLFALLAFAASPSHAQIAPVLLPGGCGTGNATGSLSYLTVDSTLKLCVNATVTVPSVTVGGFTPSLGYATLTASASSGSSALPSNSGVVAFQNTGSATVSCTLGVGSATALANEIQVPASSTVFVTVGSNTFGACIDQTGSASNLVVLAGGSGLGTGFGGGGGGGGSGGTVTQGPAGASAWLVTGAGGTFPVTGTVAVNNFPATQPISAASLPLPSGAATSANQATEITSLGTIATNSGTQATAALQTTGNTALGTLHSDLTTLNTTAGAALATGSNTIGNVGSDPSSGKGTPSSVAINVSTATTTQVVAISGSTAIYVTSFDVMAGGTGNVTFEYGTGTACATGTTALTGAYPLTAQAGIAKGNGVGAVLKVPAGNALCVLTSAAVQYSGSLSFQQF